MRPDRRSTQSLARFLRRQSARHCARDRGLADFDLPFDSAAAAGGASLIGETPAPASKDAAANATAAAHMTAR
jgi:hypothetical protein